MACPSHQSGAPGFQEFDYKKELSMQHFTLEEVSPSEKTLNLIRQIAYTYRLLKRNGDHQMYCLN